MKNVLFEELHQRLAADHLHDASRDHEVCVRILPLCAGIEIQRFLRPHIQDVLTGGGLEHGRHQIVFRPVILIAGGVGEQHVNRDIVRARQIGQILRDLVVKRELALLLQQQNRGCRELL